MPPKKVKTFEPYRFWVFQASKKATPSIIFALSEDDYDGNANPVVNTQLRTMNLSRTKVEQPDTKSALVVITKKSK
jgi:hypothetical protein